MTDANALLDAYKKSQDRCGWKGSTQRYGMDLLKNTLSLQKELRTGQYKQLPFVEFKLSERGKTRHIKSVYIRDRVVQRALCDEALIEPLKKYLIHDNGASLEGKGVAFTRRRLEQHLHEFYRKHGLNGYILKIDFSKFFDNIDHELALEALAEKIDDPQLLQLIDYLIGTFRIDISEYPEGYFDDKPFDSLTYKQSDKGERFLARGLGIGSQVSQFIGVFYPTPIDQYCKTVHQCRWYGRYMDDIYIIDPDKERLKSLLDGIRLEAKRLKMFISEKKTQILPIRRGFTFLKVRYSLTETGKIIRRLTPEAFTRERRKLKTYRRLLDEGRMAMKEINNAYRSFRCSAEKFHSYRSLQALDQLYNKLFMEA